MSGFIPVPSIERLSAWCAATPTQRRIIGRFAQLAPQAAAQCWCDLRFFMAQANDKSRKNMGKFGTQSGNRIPGASFLVICRVFQSVTAKRLFA
jgi:hypothetical protein